MIYDRLVMKAVSMIRQRSERHPDLGMIDKTFVDPGIINELNNDNHQLFFGRRGTGKTHVLRMLQHALLKDKNVDPIFIDTRVLGSTSQYSDFSISVKQRSLFLFKDILNEVYNSLLSFVIDNPPDNADQALESLELFLSSFSSSSEEVSRYSITTKSEDSSESTTNMGISGSIKESLAFSVNAGRGESEKNEITKIYDVDVYDKIVFSSLANNLTDTLNKANIRVVLLIDEWSSLPLDVQPYLAEFIKRSLLPCRKVCVKVAALEYRSRFGTIENNRYIGFEIGADIAAAPDLDSFYVFETNPEQLKSDFSEMLFRHVSSELPYDYLRKRHHIYDGETLMDKVFDEGAFEILTLAAEGVIRDLINIFTIAFAKVHRPKSYEKRTKITASVIYESARQWFERDKFQNLPTELQLKYQKIISELLVNIKSRYFLVSISNQDNETLQKLVDLRVVHLANRSFMSFLKPAELFNVFNIDFGSYVSLIEVSSLSKHKTPDFFEKEKFSLFPRQDEEIEKYVIDKQFLV